MSQLPFEYHTDAILEAREAYTWYFERSPDAARRFEEELQRAREKIEERPEAWTPYYFGTRVFQFKKFPYGLVYVELPDKIWALAVCHFSRRPGYWRKRMK